MASEVLPELLEAVRRFVDKRLVPLEAQVDEADEVPADVVDDMKALGLFGLSIPEEYGGLGLGMEEEARVAMEFGRTSPAFRSVFGSTVGIGSQGIVMDGTDAQKQRVPAAAGERRTDLVVLPHRARRGVRRRLAAHPRTPRR